MRLRPLRQLVGLGHGCTVAAPLLIARKPGERIKNDRRDSQKLALQHRAGALSPVWVPDEVHEAMRDLVRARIDAAAQLTRARQQLLTFLLRHGRTYEAGKNWTQRHRCWLAGQTFEQQGRLRPTSVLSPRKAATTSVHAAANPRMED